MRRFSTPAESPLRVQEQVRAALAAVGAVILTAFRDPQGAREDLSFFDEADEPRTTPRRGREPPRRRRPPGDHQAVQIRRAIAIGAIVVLVILAALGIKSCQDSARNSALRNYNDNVGTLIQESNASGRSLFTILSSGGGSGGANRLQNQIDQVRADAAAQLGRARALDVPDEMRAAQQNLLLG